MNELSNLFTDIKNDETISLQHDKIYHVRQDDSFELRGYYCTNTAKKHENPDGLRHAAIYLKEKSNITIDGNGATILIHGKMTPFLFDKCENITVKNLTVDYACPTMTEFTILSNNDGVCDIKINSDCLFRVEGNDIFWHGETNLNGNYYWEDNYIQRGRYIKLYDPVKNRCYDFNRDNLAFKKVKQLSNDTLRVELKNKDVRFPAGCIIQTRNIKRDQTGSLFQRCKNILLENMRIKFMHGLGIVSQFCENVTYRNCDLTPAENRTIASTADFFQFSGCRGNLTVENCKAFGAQDDYINVHGTHLRIVEKCDNNSIIVRFMHDESWGFQAFEKGDELELIKWDTLIPYGTTKVADYLRVNDTDIKLWLDRPLPDIELNKDVVENATWTPDLHVKNCDFGISAGRGVLCTTRGKVIIENNHFHNIWGPALLIEDDCNFWFESGYTKEIVFRNNQVVCCDYARTCEGSPVIRYTPKVINEQSDEFVHEKLVVTGNHFSIPNDKVHLFHLEYLKDVEITDNIFDAKYNFKSHCVGNIIDRNNKILAES